MENFLFFMAWRVSLNNLGYAIKTLHSMSEIFWERRKSLFCNYLAKGSIEIKLIISSVHFFFFFLFLCFLSGLEMFLLILLLRVISSLIRIRVPAEEQGGGVTFKSRHVTRRRGSEWRPFCFSASGRWEVHCHGFQGK